jgi:hypothetical protein
MSLSGILFLTVYFSGLLYALMSRPIVGLYLYFLAFYAHPASHWWGQGIPDLRWSLIAALVTLISILIKDRKNHGWLEKKEIKILIILVIFVITQNLWALSSFLHQEFSFLILKFLLLTYIFYGSVKTAKDLYGVIVVNIVGTAYYGWIGLTQGGGRFENAGTPGMEDGNLLSLHMIPILISASYILLCDFSKKKYLIVPLIGLTLNGIFLTQSRGGIISMILSAVVAMFFVPKSRKKAFKVYSFLAILGGIIFVGPALTDRFESTLDRGDGEVEKSAQSRLVIIKSQFEMFKEEKPLLGNGHRGTLILSPYYIDEEYMTSIKGDSKARGSHNLIMAVLVDQGLIGLFLFISITWVLLSRFWKLRKFILNDDLLDLLDREDKNIILIYVALNISLISIWISSMGVNSLKLEVSFWYYALIGLTYPWVVRIQNKISKT